MRERPKRITISVVKSLKPGQSVWDTEVQGFGVRCQRKSKVYFLKTRVAGVQRWFSIGAHGSPWTPEKARTEAQRLLGEKAAGSDPAAIRDARKSDYILADFADRYLDEYARVKKKPRSAESDESNLRVNILPRLGKRRLSSISRADIAQLHHEMSDRPGAANRCLALLSKMFNLAEKWGLRPDNSNPCRHIEKYRERKIERFLSEAELARLGQALTAVEAEGANPFAIAAIRLLIFTGARRGEIRGLKWEWIDFDNSLVRLPDSKSGKKVVYLNAPALDVLSRIPKLENNPHVIVGGKPGASLVNLQKTWLGVRQKAKLDDVRIHDLRHSFGAFGTMGGLSLQMLAKLLGHTQTATTERYSHSASNPLKDANEAIGQRLAAAMKAKNKADNVAPMNRAKA